MVTNVFVDSNIITISSKLIAIGLGLVTLFLLFEIKSRVIDKLKPTFIYVILAIMWMMVTRILGIMDELGVLVSTFYDSSVVLSSVSLLLGIISFYRYTMGVTKQIERNISEPEERVRREPPQTAIIHANKLKEMENKIQSIEERIKEGSIKSEEAGKMSRKFKLQLASLDEAFEMGYISREAYEKGKERIKEVDKSLRKKHL